MAKSIPERFIEAAADNGFHGVEWRSDDPSKPEIGAYFYRDRPMPDHHVRDIQHFMIRFLRKENAAA